MPRCTAAVAGAIVVLSACAQAGETPRHDDAPVEAASDVALGDGPTVAYPRGPTPNSCNFLDPLPTGPAVTEGDVFDFIDLRLAGNDRIPMLEWVQPLKFSVGTEGWSLWAAHAQGNDRWCFVADEGQRPMVVCDRDDRSGLLLSAANEGQAARVAALLDHATRLIDSPATARRCTQAPEEVIAAIEPPGFVSWSDGAHLVFVEQINPRPDLAQLIEVDVALTGAGAIRTELYSWTVPARQ